MNSVEKTLDGLVLLDAEADSVDDKPALIYHLAAVTSKGGVVAGGPDIFRYRVWQLFEREALRGLYRDSLDFAPRIVEVDSIPAAQSREQALDGMGKTRRPHQQSPLRTNRKLGHGVLQ